MMIQLYELISSDHTGMPIAVPVYIYVSGSSTRSSICHLIAAEDVWDPRAPGEHKYLHQYHTSCGEELVRDVPCVYFMQQSHWQVYNA